MDASTQGEIAYLISLGNNMYEIENFINFLTYSKLDRWDTPFDTLWRTLLKIMDETQREITLKELLEADSLTTNKEKEKEETKEEDSSKEEIEESKNNQKSTHQRKRSEIGKNW